MFDFPASPTVGQASNGYTWNGTMWTGGPGVSGPQTEQFFDLSGLTQKDVTVPTWAKSVEIESQLFVTATEFLTLRVSLDGSTFVTSGYANAAAIHMAAGGASAYQTYTEVASDAIILNSGGGYPNLPHQTTTVLNLTRPTTAHLFATRSYSKSYNVAAGENYRTSWWGGYFSSVTAALAIKAIRFLGGSGTTFGAGSFIRVKWLGDSAAIPQSNAISDAPNNAYQYMRGQNAWNSGGTLSGDLTISKASPFLTFNKAASGQNASILFQTNGATRWNIKSDGSIAETGSDAGSDLVITRYSDAGGNLGNALSINRATGVVTATGLAPRPAGSGVGQWQSLISPLGGALTLPAGGTWAYLIMAYSNANQTWASGCSASIAAGGTAIAGAVSNGYWTGFAWRYA